MSIMEQKSFLTSIPPFDKLTKSQLDNFAQNMDIVYFKNNHIILNKSEKPTQLYFIIKGAVQEKNDEEVVSIYSQNEIFSPMSLIEGYCKNTFVTIKECICYVVSKDIFMKLLHVNEELEKFFFQSISDKLINNINHETNKQIANVMISKVKDTNIHKAVIVDGDISIFDAVGLIKKHNVPNLLIKDKKGQICIVTDSDFRQKVILNRLSFDEKVINIASHGIIYVNEDDFLFTAQLKMSKHNIKRVVVTDKNKQIIGILDQISLSSFFATNTFLLSSRIENAKSIKELKDVSACLLDAIKSLNAKGVKIEFISKLISQLNRKIIYKVFKLLAPKSLQEHSSLVIMGSEGRGEQILKTDQDNALIIDDECDISKEELEKFTATFIQTLVDFGYPRCDGNIMISNPYWCKKYSEYKDMIFEWVNNANNENFISLAVFYDAVCVYGDKQVAIELKKHLLKLVNNLQTFNAHFAKIVMDFDVPLGFFEGFVFNNKEHKNELDLKKGGIFIIVHGIKSLCLEHGILNINTIKRIQALNEKRVLDDEFAKEIANAYNFLQSLKLSSNLQKLDEFLPVDNFINPDNLTSMQKDLLKDSFRIVNKLKKRLAYHFKLNYV